MARKSWASSSLLPKWNLRSIAVPTATLHGDSTTATVPAKPKIGDYEVAQEGKEVELKSSNGDNLKLDVDIDGGDLRLSGSLDDSGLAVVIKADRD